MKYGKVDIWPKCPPERTQALKGYRGTSLIRNRTSPGPYRSPIRRVLGGSLGGGCFLMGEIPLSVFVTRTCVSVSANDFSCLVALSGMIMIMT